MALPGRSLPLLALVACQYYRQAPPPACDRTQISIAPARIDFGGVTVGQSAITTFAISQDYCGAVSVKSVAVTGDPEFTLALQDAGAGLAASAGAVRFSPSGSNTFEGLLVLTTDSEAVPVLEVWLSGQGLP